MANYRTGGKVTALMFIIVLALLGGCARSADDERLLIVDPGQNGEAATVPDAVVDTRGVVHVVYLSGNNVFYIQSSDNGQTFSVPLRVNSEPDFASGGLFRGPDIALGRDGRVHVVWYNDAYKQKRPKAEWGVMYARLNAAGTAFEASRNLGGVPSDNFSLAADNEGRVAVAWVSDHLYVRVSSDGGDSFAAPRQLAEEPCECCATREVYLPDGGLRLLHRDRRDNWRDMYLTGLVAGSAGDDLLPAVKLNEQGWQLNACPLSGSSLIRSAGGLLAAWELKGAVWYAWLDASGHKRAPGEIAIAAAGKYPAVVSNGVTTLAVWKDGAELFWRFFDQQGRGEEAQSMRVRSFDRPAVVAAADGRYLIFP